MTADYVRKVNTRVDFNVVGNIHVHVRGYRIIHRDHDQVVPLIIIKSIY